MWDGKPQNGNWIKREFKDWVGLIGAGTAFIDAANTKMITQSKTCSKGF